MLRTRQPEKFLKSWFKLELNRNFDPTAHPFDSRSFQWFALRTSILFSTLCDQNISVVFTRVSILCPWIANVTKNEVLCQE